MSETNNSNWLFCIYKPENIFYFTSKDFWDENHCLDDSLDEISNLPDGFINLMESAWEYENSNIQEGKSKLLKAGFTWSDELDKFVNY